MAYSFEKTVRANILALEPYSCARDEYEGGDAVFLDANENPFDTGYNRYPDPHQRELKRVVSHIKGDNRHIDTQRMQAWPGQYNRFIAGVFDVRG